MFINRDKIGFEHIMVALHASLGDFLGIHGFYHVKLGDSRLANWNLPSNIEWWIQYYIPTFSG